MSPLSSIRYFLPAVLGLLTTFSFAQESTGPAAEDSAQPVTAHLQDQPDEPSPQRLPELPETVVRGRPDPFPANPLEGSTVLSPTRTETPVGQVGSAVTVVTEQEIQASGKTTVAGVLRDVAGVDVVRQGGPGGITSVFLRGMNSQHTKVLLDGVPINDPSNATRGFDFSTLDVENIERIEVLRGPQSLLYGSDAMGGVVSIVTKRGSGPLTLRATGRGGTFGTTRESLQVSGGDQQTYYSFGGSFNKTDGISQAARRLGYTERDAYSNGTLSGRFGWTPSDLLNVDYVFRWTDVDAEIDDFDLFAALPQDNLIRENLSRTFYNRIQVQSLMLDGALEQIVAFNLADYVRDDTDPGPFIPGRFRGQTRKVTWQANLLLADTNTLSVGANHLNESADSSFVSRVSQNESGVYVMDQFSVTNRWFVTAGGRWDDFSVAGPASTYRVTNLIDVPETNGAVHGSIGTGFRAPALAENLFAFGNPNLRPERSKGWDIGARQTLLDGRLTVDCTYFRNDLVDLIVFDFNTFRLENVGQARTTGVELTARWEPVDGTLVRANYTYVDPTDLDNGKLLLRRPRNKAQIGISQQLLCDRATVDLNLLYIGNRLDTRDVFLEDYYLLNLTGTYALSNHWQLFVRGANLLDESYEEVNGYGSPGVAFYGGMDFLW